MPHPLPPPPPNNGHSAPPPTSHYQPPYGQGYQHHYPPPPPYGQHHASPYGPAPHMGPLPPMQSAQDPRLPGPGGAPPMPYGQNKRLASGNHPNETPAKKKQSKWSAEEDAAIIELRGNGMKWEDISRNLPGRSAISCRLRFQNYLERRSEWDEEKKNKLARLYERFKKDMWEKIAKEMALPWRAAEAMHWQIGEVEMASRANVPVFHLAGYSPSQPGPSYQGAALTPTPLSASERRSDDSASPHSTTEGYPPMQDYPTDPSRDALARLDSQRSNGATLPHRRNSDMSPAEQEEVGQARRSPRPPTAHDSVASSLAGDRDSQGIPKQYLSPFPNNRALESPGVGASEDRRSPNRGI